MERIFPVLTTHAVADGANLRPAEVLTRALVKAGKELGLTQVDLGAVVAVTAPP